MGIVYIYGDPTDFEEGDGLHFIGGAWRTRGMLAEGDLTPGNVNAFAFNWQNPHANPLIVKRVFLDITTPGGVAGGELDCGSAAGTGVHSDNLIDGCDPDVQTVYDNLGDPGANGKMKQRLDANGGATDWLTCQILLQNELALAGKYYIEYIEEI
ncbi:hypothetical protein ES703_12799 [subsurface metagenome]